MINRGISVKGEILRDFNKNINREFLLTNGLGSYSSFCINGTFSRQYHGLFIRAINPPINRFMTLHKSEEFINNKLLDFNSVFEFSQNPFPKFKYIQDNITLEKELIMANSRDLLGINYSIDTKDEFFTDVFLNFRDFHNYSEEPINYKITKDKKLLYIELNNEKLYFYTDGKIKLIEQKFQKNISYELSKSDRGENLFDSSTKVLRIYFSGKNNYYFIASFEKLNNETLKDIRKKEINRLSSLIEVDYKNDLFYKNLILSADSFICYKKSIKGNTILAGYPWFNDWGRDTMISFTGTTLVTKRFDEARSILLTFKKYCSQGMLPNTFPDSKNDTPIYNNVDGTLWYFYSIFKFYEYTKDLEFISTNLLETLEDIIKWHIKGTRYNIKVDEKDGLLNAGTIDTQLTWMDVKFEGIAVTPRFGKAVEVNALWYNALKIFEFFCKKVSKEFKYKKYIQLIENNFASSFLYENGLYDFITENEKNTQIRPNQIFVVSLPFSLLDKESEKKVVNIVMKYLLTPFGLRSLNREDSQFSDTYIGNLKKRDFAYHQGTVWSWLIGPFIEAYSKIYGKNKIKKFIYELEAHFYNDACLGNISEIFDGDIPFKARGCFAQAWSTGELLRIYKEIIL